MSNPLVARFTSRSSPYLRNRLLDELYCHSCVLAVKSRPLELIDWSLLGPNELAEGTSYPKW